MLFFLTVVIGVGRNLYWIAAPTGVIGLGSVFSTTRVFPCILFKLDTWKLWGLVADCIFVSMFGCVFDGVVGFPVRVGGDIISD